MEPIEVKDRETLKMLEDESALTMEELKDSDAQLYLDWVKHFSPVTSEKVYIVRGYTMNEVYGLTGENAYPDDETLLAIPLSHIEKVSAIIIPRIEIDAKWFNDIVEKNYMREMMKNG